MSMVNGVTEFVEMQSHMDCEICGRKGLNSKELQMHMEHFHHTSESGDAPTGAATCPECGGHVYHLSGCQQCYSCGWSKCE